MTRRSLPIAIGLAGCGLVAWGWVPAFATDMRPQEVLIAWTYIGIGLAMIAYCVSNLHHRKSPRP